VSALKSCLPFIATGLLYVLVRYLILHQMRQFEPGAPGLVDVLLTQPAIIVFYIRQAFLPFIFGPIYGVRYVNAGNIGLTNFLLPSLLLAATAYVSYWLFKRVVVYRLGLIFFFLPLILLLDPRVFLPEQLVQDRYLYLPIIGAMIIIGGGLVELAERFLRGNAQMKERAVLAAGLVIACLLTVVTLRYNPAWNDNTALWERGIRVDPSSSLAYGFLGAAYQQAGRLTEAKAMVARALEIKPDLTLAHITRGIIALHEQRYKDAEQDLQPVLNRYPEMYAAREQLAVIYQQEGRLDEAIALSQEGRRRSPARYGLYTINLAVLHKLAGRDANALAELESLLPVLNSSHDSNLFIAWWYLGALYRDQGKVDSAVNAFERYLKATDGINDPQVKSSRDLAVQNLQQLKASNK
jgi:tetratricopeptide (TPR) repeat protein